MKASSNPHKSSQEEAAKDAINLAKKLADGKRPGVLGTVDKFGMPHMRWMATLSLHDFPLLYTITSPTSRKIEHIKHNPSVSWMFSDETMTVIVNLRGKARIASDIGQAHHVWTLLEDKSKAYFLSIGAEGQGFAVIETEIEDIDCIVPKHHIKFQATGVGLGSSSRGVDE